MTYVSFYNSPLGPVTISSDGTFITGLWFKGQKYEKRTLSADFIEAELSSLPVFVQAESWLNIYFSGAVPEFTVPVKVSGSPFFCAVSSVLQKIPYGKTVTYGFVAEKAAEILHKKRLSAQAAGGAVGKNPVSIIIPCHRVLGAGGKLTGYAAGLEIKKYLLRLEGSSFIE